MDRRLALPVLLVLLAVGCKSSNPWGPDEVERQELARYGAQRDREWLELKQQKAELAWEFDDPIEFDFGDDGKVTVREWFLEGGPGWEFVRARITYRNTTTTPMDKVKVILSILDGNGERVSASRVVLIHPWGLPVGPGKMFSDEIQVPTVGAHKRPDGWQWQLSVETRPWVPLEEIGEQPAEAND